MLLRDQPPSTKLGDVARVGWRTAHSSEPWSLGVQKLKLALILTCGSTTLGSRAVPTLRITVKPLRRFAEPVIGRAFAGSARNHG